MSRLVNEAYARAVKLIEDHRKQLEMVVERLLEVETMDGRDVEELVEFGRVLPEEERKAKEDKEEAKTAGTPPIPPSDSAEPVAPADAPVVQPADAPSSTPPPPAP